MAGLYSSQSGKYADFVTGKELSTAVKQQADRQIQAQVVSTAIIASNQNQNTAAIIQNQNSNAKALQYTINQQTYSILASQAAMTKTFAAGFNAVNNTLTVGFDSVNASISNLTRDMNAGFEMLARSIDKMSQEICDRLDALHDIMNNPRRTQARELYRSAAKNAKSGLFEEALDDLKQAVEKEKTDYISWLLKGQVELYGCGEFGNVVNIDDALASLMNAYKYVSADLTTMTAGSEDTKKIAADICYHLAYAEYIRSNDLRLEENSAGCEEMLEKAIEHYEKSLSFESRDGTKYQLARSQHLAEQNISAMAQIRSLVARDETKDYAFKVLIDPDFLDFHEEIMNTIDDVRKEKYKEALNEKEKFAASFSNLYFVESAPESMKIKQDWESLLNKDISEDESLFDYYDDINLFKEKTTEYNKMLSEPENYKTTVTIKNYKPVIERLDMNSWYSLVKFVEQERLGKYHTCPRAKYYYLAEGETSPINAGEADIKIYNAFKSGYYTKDSCIYPCLICDDVKHRIDWDTIFFESYEKMNACLKSHEVDTIEIALPLVSREHIPDGQLENIEGVDLITTQEVRDYIGNKIAERKRIDEVKAKEEKKENRSTIIFWLVVLGIIIFAIIRCKQ